ncbi:CxxH/CxxC protein [Salirhabdus salicampi]|uniref:CxxH/CxxC protein n=1 Tax=Salirhabdus salicampi TaxID=476102 RepID=UPI0020C31ABE|nr:CxxH/CxxC protein [Salirhabdus salicampi]MCP8617237.1 CxxH/CxxC protein [Salirhabdus salicampi]
MKQYVCGKHVDLAMEKLIDETAFPPKLEQLTGNEELSTACEYCENNALYVVANIDSDTK